MYHEFTVFLKEYHKEFPWIIHINTLMPFILIPVRLSKLIMNTSTRKHFDILF